MVLTGHPANPQFRHDYIDTGGRQAPARASPVEAHGAPPKQPAMFNGDTRIFKICPSFFPFLPAGLVNLGL